MATRRRMPRDLDEVKALADVPRILGYGAVAARTVRRSGWGTVVLDPDGTPQTLTSSTVSSYFYDSIDAIEQGRATDWLYVVKPDFILVRSGQVDLPGWLPETIVPWQRARPGAGRRDSAGDRRRATDPTSSGDDEADA